METRANYVLIGAFTLAGLLASLGFFLWLAKFEIDKQFAYYDILFSDVSGLSNAGDVRFNGLPVGQVTQMALAEGDSNKVRVRIEIGADVPVKEDSIATLELQGVTGVSYVAITGGTAEAPLLRDVSDADFPVIKSKTSAVQSLFEGIPAVMSEAVDLLKNLNQITGDDNRQAVGNMLDNLESASGNLDQALKDFSALSADLSSASKTIAAFTARLDEVADAAVTTMGTTDETLRTARDAIENARPMIENATRALESARRSFDSADALMQAGLPELIARIDATAAAIETVVSELGTKTDGVIGTINTVGDRAIARLDQAEATIAKLDAALETANAMMTAIGDTARAVDQLAKGDATRLVAETRQAVAGINTAVATVNRVLAEDVPVIMGDIRRTTGNVGAAIDAVSANLTGASGKLDVILAQAEGAITAATTTFQSANATLATMTGTLERAQGTLGAAEKTFTGINRIIDEDATAIATDLRTTTASLRTTLDRFSEDLPRITADVQQTLDKTSHFVETLDGVVLDNSDQIETFMQAGLPQFVRFVQEGSRLIATLQRLTAKIESNPARFLLGTQAPEFRN